MSDGTDNDYGALLSANFTNCILNDGDPIHGLE